MDSAICLYAILSFHILPPFNPISFICTVKSQILLRGIAAKKLPFRFWPISGFQSVPPDPSDTSNGPFFPLTVPLFLSFLSSVH